MSRRVLDMVKVDEGFAILKCLEITKNVDIIYKRCYNCIWIGTALSCVRCQTKRALIAISKFFLGEFHMPGVTLTSLVDEAMTFDHDFQLIGISDNDPNEPHGDSFEDRCRKKAEYVWFDSRDPKGEVCLVSLEAADDESYEDLGFDDSDDDEWNEQDRRIAAFQSAELARQLKENRISYPTTYADHFILGTEVDEFAPARECSRTLIPVKDLCHKRIMSKSKAKSDRENFLDYEERLVFDRNRHCAVTKEMRARRSRKCNARDTIRGATVDLIVHVDNFGLTTNSWLEASARVQR